MQTDPQLKQRGELYDRDDLHLLTATPSEYVNPVAFGRVLGKLEAQEKDIQELKEGHEQINGKLDTLIDYQSRQRGAFKLFLLVVSGVAAIITWVIALWADWHK